MEPASLQPQGTELTFEQALAQVKAEIVAGDNPEPGELVGRCVRLDGLQSKPELNGLTVSCVAYVQTTGRITVSTGDKKFNIKPMNVRSCVGSSYTHAFRADTPPRLTTQHRHRCCLLRVLN